MMRWERLILCVAFCICWLTASLFAQSDGDVAIELSGISVSAAYDLQAGAPLDLSDTQLMKLLFRCGKVSRGNFEKWSRFADDVSWQQLREVPQRFRFWTFRRKLQLNQLSQIRFPEQIATDELKGVYLAKCVNDAGQEVYLIARSAPRKLTLNQSLDQPISFSGFFYNNVAVGNDGGLVISDLAGERMGAAEDTTDEVKDGEQIAESGSAVVPLFIANRFAWHPTATHAAMGVTASQVELASHGVDIGLFDFVRRQNSKVLSKFDADAFYQMLAAANSLETLGRETLGRETLVKETLAEEDPAEEDPALVGNVTLDASAISFTDLMSAPTRYFGDAIALSGRLRQCVPIQIVDADRQRLVGLERYYQVSLFPDLKGRAVVVRSSEEESIKFDQFPVTVCLPRLPAGMTADQLEGRPAKVIGHFYRFIKYQSQITAEAGQSGQVSPLVMASRLEVVPPSTSAAGVDLLMRVLLIVTLTIVAGSVAYSLLKDRNKRSHLMAQRAEVLPEKIDLGPFEDQIDD